jgi:hypothetical protein|tara:strand:+ start:8760 stop:8954 length:195 start_codon:yes stop_codon:yes gene_type:complete
MEQTIENFTGTKNVEITSMSSQGDVQAGIEFIYNMREHLLDVGIATVFALTVYGLVLFMKAKIK